MRNKTSVPLKNSLRFRLMIFGIIMSIVPLVTLGYFYVQNFKSNLEKNITLNIAASTERVASDLEVLIGGQLNQITTFTNVVGDKLFAREKNLLEGTLYNLLQEAPFLEEISLVDFSGREIIGVSRRLVLKGVKDFKNEEAFTQLKRGNLKWSRTFIDQYGQVRLQRIIPIERKLDGQFLGGFILEVSLRGVIDEISRRNPEYQGRIFVVERHGKLVGHQDFSQVLRQTNVQESLAVKRFLQIKETTMKRKVEKYPSYDGQEVLGTFAPVSNLDWAVIQEVPVKNAYFTVNQLIARLSLASILLAVGVTAINTYVGVRFSNIIKKLEYAVDEIRGGNLEKEINIEGKNELSRLAETLNNMRSELSTRRQQEQAIRQAEKLSSLGLMAAGVAHELNNPLAVMSAYAEDLQDRMKEESEQELIENGDISNYLETIIKQTKRCKKITSGLLNFSRQSGNEGSFSNIKELVESTLELINYRIKKNDIYIEIKIEEPAVYFKGNSQEVQQVLLNVITNALDALQPGGLLKFHGKVTDGNFLLKIADNGSGIEGEHMERLMDPFFTTKEPGKGTGLGLAIVFSIMQRLGGSIEVESEYGEGTIVTLTFPIVKEVNNAG